MTLQTIVRDDRRVLLKKGRSLNKGNFLEIISRKYAVIIPKTVIEGKIYKNELIELRTKYSNVIFQSLDKKNYLKRMNSFLNNFNVRIIIEEHSCKEGCETIYSRVVFEKE